MASIPSMSQFQSGLGHASNIAGSVNGIQQAFGSGSSGGAGGASGSTGGGGAGGGGTNGFIQGAVGGSQAGGNQAQAGGEAMMGQIRETADMQMKFQTEMGIIQLMVKMNEALAKMFKSIGEAIKGLA